MFASVCWRRQWLPLILIGLVVFLSYSNAYQNQFVYDDEFLLQKNSFLHSWEMIPKIFQSSSTAGAGGVDSFYRPMQTMAYLLVYQIAGGLTPPGFHFLNIFLHGLNAILIFLIGQKLGFNRYFTLISTLIWAVHPIHTEAVTYMSATADPLHTLFCLAGVFVLLPDFTPAKIFLASICFVLALLSKESAIVFPALAVITYYYYGPRRSQWKAYSFSWPLWLLALSYLIIRKTIFNFDDSFNFYKTSNIYTESIFVRWNTFLATIPSYLELLIWPQGLHMDRQFSVFIGMAHIPVLLGLLLLLLLGISLVVEYKLPEVNRWRPLTWGFLWLMVAYSPHTGIALPVNSFFLEHWMYLPTTILFLGLGQMLARTLVDRPKLRVGFSLSAYGIIILLGVSTYHQNEIWQNPVSFYENILKYNEKSPRAHNNLAMALSDAQRLEEAKKHYLKAIELVDVYPQTRHNLARLLMSLGQIDEAILNFKRAIEINPNFYQSYLELAKLLEQRGQTAEARSYFEAYQKILAQFSN